MQAAVRSLTAGIVAIVAAGLLSFVAGQEKAAAPDLRLIAFDTKELPRVRGVLDARTGSDGPPALSAADFRLSEKETRAAGSRTLKFRDAGMPLALIIAVDASPSMRGEPLAAIRRGVAQLVAKKREGDRVAILSFADDIKWDARWDASDASKQEALRRFDTRGNRTRLYDGIWEAVDELSAEAGREADFPSRLCILVMSDGHDEGSGNSLAQVASRLRGSRVRVDAVGLARSPVWLKNLQTLANAGFGEFQSTSTPEGLTTLLEQGIERALDAPVIEFTADALKADGATHRLGLEYVPTSWQDQMDLTFPSRSLMRSPLLFVAGGAAVLVTGVAVVVVGKRRHRRPPVAVHAPADPASPPAPRGGIVIEATPPQGRIAAPAGTVVEAGGQAERYPVAAAGRQSTMVAPERLEGAVALTLVALSGPYAGQRFPVSVAEFWIGSSTNNHLCLSADPAVSGNHACLRIEERFQRLYDNGSLNHTYVNGRDIGREATLVRSGDRLRVGQSEFTIAS